MKPGDGDKLIHRTAIASVLAVAVVAAWVSYRHAVTVVTAHGEPGVIGHLYPVGIDGLIVAASMVLLDSARHREKAPQLALWLLGFGIGGTLAANVLAGVTAGWLGSVVAAWPALAFIGSYELLMMLVRAAARRASHASGNADAPDARTHFSSDADALGGMHFARQDRTHQADAQTHSADATDALKRGASDAQSLDAGVNAETHEAVNLVNPVAQTFSPAETQSASPRGRKTRDARTGSKSDAVRVAITEIARATGRTEADVTSVEVASHLNETGTRVRASYVADVRRRDANLVNASDAPARTASGSDAPDAIGRITDA